MPTVLARVVASISNACPMQEDPSSLSWSLEGSLDVWLARLLSYLIWARMVL